MYEPPPGAPPGWGAAPPPPAPGFAPEHARIGGPEHGLNPFGATVQPGGFDAAQYGMPPLQPAAPAVAAPPPYMPPAGPSAPAMQAPLAPASPYGPPPQGAPPPAMAPTAPPGESRLAPGGPFQRAAPGAPRAIAAFLVSYETELGTFWPLYQGTNAIGRQGAADGLDIQIDHATTSSRHAMIHVTARPGRVQIEDIGSTNGTFVGDRRLDTGVGVEVLDGEKVRFGGYTTIIKIV